MVLSSKIKVSPKPRKSGAGVDFSLILRSLWHALGIDLERRSDFCLKKWHPEQHQKFESIFRDFHGFWGRQASQGKPTSGTRWLRARKKLRYFAARNLIPNTWYLVLEFSWILGSGTATATAILIS